MSETILVTTQAEMDAAIVRQEGDPLVRIEVCGSATVNAYDSARVNASGSATVNATKFVVVVRRSRHVTVSGGTVPDLSTLIGWCEYTGAAEHAPGTRLLYKGLDAEFRSDYGTVYLPGTEVVATDWDGGAAECGGGLHFCAHPAVTLQFARAAARFVACEVAEADMVVHEFPEYTDKIKARACRVLYECDVAGEHIPDEAVVQ